MENKQKLILNSTQIPNIILDEWLRELTPAQFKVIMVIARQTYGWHKEKDRLSYSQLIEKTGYKTDTIVVALKSLKATGRIIVTDTNGNELRTKEECRGKSLYYKLNLATTRENREVDIEDQTTLKNREVDTNYSENPTWKNRDTKETYTKDAFSKEKGAGSNKINNLRDALKKKEQELGIKHQTDNRISTGWQNYAHETVQIFEKARKKPLDNKNRARIFDFAKSFGNPYLIPQKTKDLIAQGAFNQFHSFDEALPYLFGACRRML